MPQPNNKNCIAEVYTWIKAHVLNFFWLIGLAFGLIAIYAVNGWMQYFFIALGCGCFTIDRWRSDIKDAKSDE